MKRNRLASLLICLGIIFLGLGSRKYGSFLPGFIAAYSGDTLWAMMVFFLFGGLFPAHSTKRVFAEALVFSYAIEATQLYHAPWIDAVRSNRLAALVLGRGFLWSDLICYTVGAAVAAVLDSFLFSGDSNVPPSMKHQE